MSADPSPPAPIAVATPTVAVNRLVGVALISASVLLLQLVQTRIFSVMLWHHLTYLVVTFTMLGFAAGGAVLACRPGWLEGITDRRLALASVLFGATTLAGYAIVARSAPEAAHTGSGIAMAAFHYGLLVVPMIFGGFVIALALGVSGASVGRVYAVNMGGSALGCIVYIPLLRWLGGEGSVLASVALAFAGAAWFVLDPAVSAGWRGKLYGMLTGLAVAAAILRPTALFEVPVAPSKAMSQIMAQNPDLRVESTRWDPLCRLDVVGSRTEPRAAKTIYQDGDAPTVMPVGPASADVGAKEGLAYLLFRDMAPKVLAIGIGGGIDILQARAADRPLPEGQEVDFTGVEINASMADLMMDDYREACGDRYRLPGVRVELDEGRSWLRRADEKYDIIQMTGTDTYAALSSGSYVMSESYLYTGEAYDDFLDHLTPDGVISVMRFRFEPPRELLRLAAIAVDALRRDGATDPADHVIVLGFEGPKWTIDGREVGMNYGSMLVCKRPFRSPEVERYRRYAANFERVGVLHAPGYAPPGEISDFFRSVAEGSDADFRESYLYNLDPVTDDSPFFFRYHRWSSLWGSSPSSSEEPDWNEYRGIVGGEPIGLMMLATVLAESALLVAMLVLIPLLLFRREGLAVPAAGRWVMYFMGLGAGYILVEIVAMQRFVLFLGHPGYAITVVLVTFLSFSGLGSFVAGRSNDPGRVLRRSLMGVIALVVVLNFGLPAFFDWTLMLPLAGRVVLSVVLLAPVAFLMGMPFPSGMSLVSRRAAALVPWAFGVNGGASVIASVVGILVAMAAGFSVAFMVAAGAYGMALVAGWREGE